MQSASRLAAAAPELLPLSVSTGRTPIEPTRSSQRCSGPFFSDVFDVDREALRQYGAFDVSLVNDLPLFIDPFLLFHSEKPVYRDLHEKIIGYLRFLRQKSAGHLPSDAELKLWYSFPEIHENWLGFSRAGNSGSGLGLAFARQCGAHVLSTLAAILAMIPVARSVFWGPMAPSIMGGLVVATVLTLFFLPALYAACFRVRRPK